MVGVSEEQVTVAAELVQQLARLVVCGVCAGRGAGRCGQQCGEGARGRLAGHVRRLGDCLTSVSAPPAASLQVFSELPQEVPCDASVRVPFLLRGPVGRVPAPVPPPAPSPPLTVSPQDVHISIRAGGTLTRVTVSARGRVSVRTHTERPVQTSPPPAPPPRVTTASRDTSSAHASPHLPRDTPATISDVFPSAPLPTTDNAPTPPTEQEAIPLSATVATQSPGRYRPEAPQPAPEPEHEHVTALDSDSESVVEGTPHNSVPVVSGSCLETAARGDLARVGRARGWRVLQQYSPELTHLVVGVDGQGRAQRSVKYMRALAAGKWIVAPSWLRAGGGGPEEPHEALDFSGEPGPALARRAAAAGRPLLRGLRFLLRPPYDVLEETSLADMVRDAGGEIGGCGEGAVLLGEDGDAAPAALRERALPLSVSWLLDSLGRQTLAPPGDALLCDERLLSPPATRTLHGLQQRAGDVLATELSI